MYYMGSSHYRNSKIAVVNKQKRALFAAFCEINQSSQHRIVIAGATATEVNNFYKEHSHYTKYDPDNLSFQEGLALADDAVYLNFHASLSIQEIDDLDQRRHKLLVKISREILLLASKNAPLSIAQQNFVEKLDLVFQAQICEDFSKEKSIDRFNFDRGSLLLLSFNLKNTAISQTTNYSFSSNDYENDTISIEKSAVGAGYYSGNLNLLYLVTKNETTLTLAQVGELLLKILWTDRFRKLYPTTVAVEALKIKALSTPKGNSSSYTISTALSGELPSSEYRPSSKPFVFGLLAPLFRNAPKNSFTLRLPLVGAPKPPNPPTNSKIISLGRDIANALSTQLILDDKNIQLQLMVTSNSQNARTKYAAVTYVSCAGFLSNVKSSKYGVDVDALYGNQPQPVVKESNLLQQGILINPKFQKPYPTSSLKKTEVPVIDPTTSEAQSSADGVGEDAEGSTSYQKQ